MFSLFNFTLIILSLVFLIYSIFICKKMVTAFNKKVQKKAGHIMMSLIIIFFLGYIGYLLFSYNLLYSNFLAALLFFFTAFFIMLVLQVNHSLIISLTMRTLELKEFSEDLLKETDALTSTKERLETIKSMLEQKNKELEVTLKKMYASKLNVVKSSLNLVRTSGGNEPAERKAEEAGEKPMKPVEKAEAEPVQKQDTLPPEP